MRYNLQISVPVFVYILLDRQCSADYNFLQVGKNSWSGNYSCPWFLLVDLMVCQFELFFFLWREIMDFTLLMQLELILTVWRIEPRCVRVLVCTFGFVKTFFLRWYSRKTLVDWFRDISQNRGWVVGLPVYIQRYISLFSEWKGRCFPLFTGVQPKAGTGLKMQTVSVVFSTLHC